MAKKISFKQGIVKIEAKYKGAEPTLGTFRLATQAYEKLLKAHDSDVIFKVVYEDKTMRLKPRNLIEINKFKLL